MSKLFQSNTERASYTVVYNLVPYAPGIILPIAYVVSYDNSGDLNYIRKLATEKTIGAYGLEMNEVRKALFEGVQKLEEKQLAKKFSPPKKAPKAMKTLLEDRVVKQQIVKFIDRELGQMINLISEHKLPLVWNIERKDNVQQILIKHTGESFEPLFYFRKQEDGILYRLKIQKGKDIWTIKEHDVTPLTRYPGWFIGDFGLYQLEKVSGLFLKPFCFANEIIIPPHQLKTYFKRVILPVVSKTEIEAEGFDIISQNKLRFCRLESVPDYNQKGWGLAVEFVYEKAVFTWNNSRTDKSTLEFNEADEPVLFKTTRNPEKEKNYLEQLKHFGFENKEGIYFTFAEKEEEEDEFRILAWLSENQKKLEATGFEVRRTQIGSKTIALAAPKLSLKQIKQRDWFDIYGSIEIGEFTIPFPLIFPFIRDKNRFYPLPDNTFFIIPQEWMTKFAGLAQFAKTKGNKASLAKSQYSLLQEAGIAEEIQDILENRTEDVDFQVSKKLKATLRPYQLEGVKWLFRHYQDGLGACLADDMGLGKTLQTIAILLHAKENKEINTLPQEGQMGMFQTDNDFLNPLKALIVLPSSLVFNWAAEITKFAPSLTVYKYTGAKRQKDPKILCRFDVILTTYQTALRDKEILKEVDWEYIVLDESQQIKNKNSKIFKAINEFEAEHKLSLSGTPIENSLADLWAQMEFINSGHLGSFAFFKREFMLPIQKGQDEEKKERLRNLVQPFLLRRTKDLVAKDLPPLTEQVFYCEMTAEQKKLYEAEKSSVRNYLLENYNNSSIKYHSAVIQSLMKLRQLSNHPKLLKSAESNAESGKFKDVLENISVIHKGGHKVLIFSSFVKHLALFQEEFDLQKTPYTTLTGDMNAKKRQQAIHDFENNDSIKTFFISLKAGGTGLNLTAASYVFILDPWWNPFAEQQAFARAHRIGQTKQVIATKFITKDSIEEKILKLQDEKRALADDIINGGAGKAFTREEIGYLFG